MKVRAIKGIKHDFAENAGPSETETIGIEIDGYYIELGKYYFGPYGNDVKDHRDTMAYFAKTCEYLFNEANNAKEPHQ